MESKLYFVFRDICATVCKHWRLRPFEADNILKTVVLTSYDESENTVFHFFKNSMAGMADPDSVIEMEKVSTLLSDAEFAHLMSHPLLGHRYPIQWRDGLRTTSIQITDRENEIRENEMMKSDQRALKVKRSRCMTCSNCNVKDCGLCLSCIDKPRNGGPGVRKQGCLLRPLCMKINDGSSCHQLTQPLSVYN